MPGKRLPYPAEFRQQIVELVRAGRSPEELSQEFEPSAQTIRNWVVQAGRPRCGPAPGRADDRRAGPVAPPAPRKQAAARRPRERRGNVV